MNTGSSLEELVDEAVAVAHDTGEGGEERGASNAPGDGADSGNAQDNADGLQKVTVFNVGKRVSQSDFEKFLKRNKVVYKKAKKPVPLAHATLSFETVKQRTQAMERLSTLHGMKQCSSKMLKPVLTVYKSRERKEDSKGRNEDEEEGEGEGAGSKRRREADGEDPQERTVAQATASLYGVMTYEEQLKFKEQELMEQLYMRLPKMLRIVWEKKLAGWRTDLERKRAAESTPQKRKEPLPAVPRELRCPAWCKDFKTRNGVVPYEVLPIVPSPEQEGYRNKCEFSLALNKDGQPTAGFMSSRFKAGAEMRAESPKDCPQVHRDMKAMCVKMDRFMRRSSFKPYEDHTMTGVWRMLLVRRSVAKNEMLAKIVVNLRELGVGSDEWKKEEVRLIETFSHDTPGEETTNLVSLWLQEYDGVSAPDDTHPVRLLWGKDRLEEELLGIKFSISPNSFFQTNTLGAEALYRVVIENLELGEKITLFDICCGAGTIGICAANAGGAFHVYGSDICVQAIQDANLNARINDVRNCDFQCGKAQDLIGDQLRRARLRWNQSPASIDIDDGPEMPSSSNGTEEAKPSRARPSPCQFAAVVDPPRAGMHSKGLRVIRDTSAITRLVYVSCNPTKSLVNDATLLCGPSSAKTKGIPFRPVKAIPVDMFPLTPHMEVVMIFERIDYDETPLGVPHRATVPSSSAAITQPSATGARPATSPAVTTSIPAMMEAGGQSSGVEASGDRTAVLPNPVDEE